MIRRFGSLFVLHTRTTTYAFRVLASGHLQHLYYGRRIRLESEADGEVLAEKQSFLRGNTNGYDEESGSLTLEDVCLEMSALGKGDIRDPFVSLTWEDGSSTCDFLFEDASITKGKPEYETLPGSYDESGQVDHLCVTLRENYGNLALELHYYVYEDCQVIARSSRLINGGQGMIRINRLMSLQLDMDCGNYTMTTFGGAWAREMCKVETPLRAGRHVNESLTGTSSNRANPLVLLHEADCSQDQGVCYGFNLIYSGNHYEAAQVNSFGKLRFLSGIHPETFSWNLGPGESFEAPEAYMTCGLQGMNSMSQNMHDFIRRHIVRGDWKYRRRPVLVNSWEAMYFNLNESKLLNLAKAGAELGAELFVMDDGWFGERKDDHHSLGDWQENPKKLPGGLAGLGEKINALGLHFGIWMEPEMVNVNSNLYHEHPDWAVDIPEREHSEGRNQRILDLTREEVQDFIIETVTSVLDRANITYLKWDMNRTFTDIYSRQLPADRQGEMVHRYYMGFYRCMKELTTRFPQVLFEGCSGGGNRFDPGMLCYFPQIWASDDTDALARSEIQNNYSYGYPTSVLGCHVSSCPNHQTLRNTPLQTRFQVAAFGLLGYECNLNDLSDQEKREIKEQIRFYKKNWKLFQSGRLYRGRAWSEQEGYCGVLKGGSGNVMEWTIVSRDRKHAAGLLVNKLAIPNWPSEIYRPKGLNPGQRYHFTNRQQDINILEYGELINTLAPIHIKNGSLIHRTVAKSVKMGGDIEDYTCYGDVLMAGVRLKAAYAATGLAEDSRHWPDYASRMYLMEAVEEEG